MDWRVLPEGVALEGVSIRRKYQWLNLSEAAIKSFSSS